MPTYYLYVRKSSESEDRQVLSIESQIKELQDYAAKNNLKIAKIFTESKSAKKPGRPVFNEIMKEIWKKGNTGVLCWKLDRLARNVVDGGNVIYALEEGKIFEILTPFHPYQNNSNDKFMMNLEFGMAKKYVDDLSDNVKRGLRAKILTGWYPGLAPIGYLNYKNPETGEDILIKDPKRFEIVRKIWDGMLFGNYSVREILEMANEKWGLRNRKRGGVTDKMLSLGGIYRILTNSFYTGVFHYKGEVYQGKHEPMVTFEEFDKVQILLGRKDKSKHQKHNFPFTGMIKCGECGSMITAEEKMKTIKGTGHLKKYVYYRCTKKKKLPCSQKYIEQDQLVTQILEFLKSIQIPKEYFDWTLKYLERVEASETKKDTSVLDNQKKQGEALQKRLDNLLALKISESNSDGHILSDEEYSIQKTKILNEKLRIEEEINKAHTSSEEVYKLTANILKLARYGYFWFKNGAPEEQKRIFACLGSNYVIKDRKLNIQAKKPLLLIKELLVSSNSQNGWLEPDFLHSNTKRNGIPSQLIPVLSGLVNDVRTEIERNPEKTLIPVL